MKYDISKASAPKMPELGRGTECIKILLSQVSKDMQEPFVPMLFLFLKAHLPVGKNQLKGLMWKDICTKRAFSDAKMALFIRENATLHTLNCPL